MNFFSARRILPACILAAAVVAALVAPGAASASLGTPCSGVAIVGQGSSFQKLAQELWDPSFNTAPSKYACNGTQGSKGTPKVGPYNPSGSGAGLKSWGADGSGEHKYEATNAYAGTDEAPNPTEKAEIEANELKLIPNTVLTVPIAQGADVIIVNLPTGCTATSTSNKGRLVLNNSTLEAIWRGTISKWSEITDNGDKLSGTGCNPATSITRAVRLDASGTTHILKRYLSLISKSPFETEKGENKTWNEVAEGTENTTWPKAATVVRPSGNGNGKLVAKVAETPGSIGYSDLATARANSAFIPPTGGANKATFWVPIQNKSGETVTYADPSKNKDVAALNEANCAKTEYTNGETAFPPASVTESWSEVTTKTSEPKYTICGLTYDLALSSYSDYAGTSEGEATTVENFLSYVLDTSAAGKGGQSVIKNHDYEPLTGTVLKEAQAGVRGKKGKGGVGF
jgi:ABC-type phosphate transport system substrate-binding protein